MKHNGYPVRIAWGKIGCKNRYITQRHKSPKTCRNNTDRNILEIESAFIGRIIVDMIILQETHIIEKTQYLPNSIEAAGAGAAGAGETHESSHKNANKTVRGNTG